MLMLVDEGSGMTERYGQVCLRGALVDGILLTPQS